MRSLGEALVRTGHAVNAPRGSLASGTACPSRYLLAIGFGKEQSFVGLDLQLCRWQVEGLV